MDSEAPLKCLHCRRLFVPDCRHRKDQRYCSRPACKRTSRAASRKGWLAKPEQKDWWHGEWNVDRVRQWRGEHPGYWRRWKRKKVVALQDTMKSAQVSGLEKDRWDETGRCATRYVPEFLKAQSPVVVGLIAQMYGEKGDVALQDTIAAVTVRLFEKGRAVIGQ
jgi:hypothetical protein